MKTQQSNNLTIIDAHAHLWLRQDTSWNGMPIRTTENGRSFFLTEEVQMLPPFMIDGRNTAEVFLSNMNYAQVGAACIVQEFIDGWENAGGYTDDLDESPAPWCCPWYHGNTVITVKGNTTQEWGADWWSQCKDEIEEELANESEQ